MASSDKWRASKDGNSFLHKCSNDRSSTPEYKEVMAGIRKLVFEHKSSLVAGEPQLNMCDPAVMVSKQ